MTHLKFQPGDHVMVPMKVTGVAPGSHWRYSVLLRDYEKDFGFWVPESALASATLIERPLAVGEKVEWDESEDVYKGSGVLVDKGGERGCVRRESGLGKDWEAMRLSELRRAEERG